MEATVQTEYSRDTLPPILMHGYQRFWGSRCKRATFLPFHRFFISPLPVFYSHSFLLTPYVISFLLHCFTFLLLCVCSLLFFTPLKVALFYGHWLLSHVLTLPSVHYIYQFFHPAHVFYPESGATNLYETLVII